MNAYAWCDGSNGSSKGDFGAAAYVIASAKTQELIEEHVEKFPNVNDTRFTNNDMEMTAIFLCLQASLRLGVTDLRLHSDSEWCVRILLQEYVLREKKFESLVESIWGLASELDSSQIVHVRREMNSRADWLCTSAVGGSRQAAARPPAVIWIPPRPQIR